ncbi:MAG TPA: hypothetical protein PLG89_05905 [Arenimonas sp.]|nr:hypothetical protein [Arenimonas sp.]
MSERSADYIPSPDDDKPGCGSLIVKGVVALVILAGLLFGTCTLMLSRY